MPNCSTDIDVRSGLGRCAIYFDGGGLGSIAVREASRREGTLRERYSGGGIDCCLDSIAVGTLRERVLVGSIVLSLDSID